MSLPKDSDFIQVDIERYVGGNLELTSGSWKDAETELIAVTEIDIQPKGSNERDNFQDNNYKKNSVGFIKSGDINFQPGYYKMKYGDIVDGKYMVVDIKDWLTHIELILEER